MSKEIAIIRGLEVGDDYNFNAIIATSITEWKVVSDDEYTVLLNWARYIVPAHFRLIEKCNDETFSVVLEKCKVHQEKEDKRQRAHKIEFAKRQKQTEKKKEEKEREQLMKLAEKYGKALK